MCTKKFRERKEGNQGVFLALSSQLSSDLPLELSIFTSIASLKKKVIMPPAIVVVKNCVKNIVLGINFYMKKKFF